MLQVKLRREEMARIEAYARAQVLETTKVSVIRAALKEFFHTHAQEDTPPVATERAEARR
jgi:hypothetical protein